MFNSSQTPRTDAEVAECDETLPFTLAAQDRGRSLFGQVVRASFARQLERELATARADAVRWADEVEQARERGYLGTTADGGVDDADRN